MARPRQCRDMVPLPAPRKTDVRHGFRDLEIEPDLDRSLKAMGCGHGSNRAQVCARFACGRPPGASKRQAASGPRQDALSEFWRYFSK